MVAGIEVSGFEAAFAARKDPAWHMLGTVFEDELTTAEMLRTAHLDNWNVRVQEVHVPGVSDERWAVPCLATVRNNPFDGQPDVLGFVGERYKVLQNEELFAFGDSLLDGGGVWDTAGSIKNGRVVFGSLEVGSFVLDPTGAADETKTYLLVQTSHDGSTSIVAANTPVRTVCQNTLAIALSSARQTFKIRHTQSLEGRVAEARNALAISFAYQKEFEKFAQDLYQTEMNIVQFDKVLDTLAPYPGKDAAKAAVTRWANNRDRVLSIFMGSADGPDTSANIAGTAWAGFNAVMENLDWYRNPRKGNAENVLAAASGFDPVTNATKNKVAKVFAEAIA